MKRVLHRIRISYLSAWFSAFLVGIPPLVLTGQYSVDFSRVYGGSAIDEGFGVDVDNPTGLVISGGRSFSSDIFLHENEGGSDFWMMQMTPDGDTIWSRTYGGSDNDDLRVVKYDENGITAFGTTWSDGDGDVPNHMGQVGAWLVSTDMAGNIGLSAVYSGLLGEQGIDFYPMTGGGHTLLVQSSSPVLQGEMSHGNFDFWVARVDAFGGVEWSNFFGGVEADIPARILRITGGFIVIGSTASVNGDVTENAGGYDYWILRLDLDGGLVWQKTFGGSGDDLARDGIVMPDGSILIAGESDSQDGDRSMSFGGKDVWLISIDLDGNLLWEKSYGGSEDDAGQRIARAGESRIALLAHSKSEDGNLTGNKGRQDVWLSYLTLGGTVVQQMNYGGTLDDYGRGLVVSSDSIVYMIGSSLSNNGNIPFPGYPIEDLWLMRMAVDTLACATNNACFLFDDVNFAILRPESNGAVVCINGCNVGAEKGPSGPPGCTNFQGAAAWFKVKTDDLAEVLSIQVTSPEFNIPQVLVMQGFNCLNFTPVNCDYGIDGVVIIVNLAVDPDTAYYVIVGDGAGLEGRFDLCVSVQNIDFCNRDPRIYVTQTSLGSPMSGPFQPGEDVQICYEVNEWDKIDCNGLQGIVPEFGDGWDSLSFNSMGRPVEIDTMLEPIAPNGEWDWWPLGSVHYNFTNPVFGYSGGQTLPTGWYFVNYDDPPPNEDPDESIGDLTNCVNNNSRWKICFTLTTVAECTENLDCSVKIKSFADGEIGAIVSQACQNDPPITLNRFLNCCLSPFIDPIPNFTICSGDTLIISLESSLNPPVTYTWGVNITGSIIGAQPGVTNNVIFQQLTNLSNTPGTVTYTVRGSSQMCETPFEEFTVTVLPQPSANMTLVGPSVVCRDEEALIRFDFIGDGPFIAEFTLNGVVQPPILSETSSTIIAVPLTEDAIIAFTGYRDRNCVGNPNGAFFVSVLQPGEKTLNISICEGDSVQIGTHIVGFPGMYEFALENASSNGCDSIVYLDLQVFAHEELNLELQICEGQSVMVGANIYSESGFYTDSLLTAHGCDSVVNLLLTVSNEIVIERNRVICAGSSIEFGGETIFQDGTYYDTIPISASCDSIYILHLNVLNVIVLIQTVIEPDTGQSSGSILIQVAGGIPPYSYLWSNGDTTNHPMNLDAGNYGLTVTDVLGCTAEYNFFLISSTEELLPGFNDVRVFPNPVSQGTTLNVLISREDVRPQLIFVGLRDVQGKTFHEGMVMLLREDEHLSFPVENLPGGIFFLQMTDESTGASLTRRFIVHKGR
ncbi:MAG TPA: PKD-like domain-containing protein [Saprospiraceae bacterium]|nr:PKD-like domain-containing protein [Saprospiraceae bacterium]